MKKRLCMMLAAVAASTALSASAADLPSRKAAPVYAPPTATWTGFYAGLNAGYNAGTNADVSMEHYAGPWTTAPGGGTVLYMILDEPGMTRFGWMPGRMAVFPSIHCYACGSAPGYRFPVGATQGSLGGSGGLFGGGGAGSARNTQSGFIGGAQVGYNYQYGSSIVLGLEADIQGAGIRGTTTGGGASQATLRTPLPAVGDTPAAPNAGTITSGVSFASVQGGVDWLGTVRGRLGFLATPTLLLYGAGGLAYGNAWANVEQTAIEHHSATVDLTSVPGLHNQTSTWLGGGHQNQLLTGWTAGGGLEWMFMQNWSLKAEALYWDLGRMNVETTSYGLLGNREEDGIRNNIGWGRTGVSFSGVQAKAGVNYHFNFFAPAPIAPVAASY